MTGLARTFPALAPALVSLALAACGSPTDTPTTAEPSTEDSSSSSSASRAPVHGETSCALFMEGEREESLMWRVPDAINGLGASATQEQVDAMFHVHDDLQIAAAHAPDDLEAALLSVDEPFADFTEQIRSGGTSIEVHTGDVAEAVSDVMRICADNGYKVSDAE